MVLIFKLILALSFFVLFFYLLRSLLFKSKEEQEEEREQNERLDDPTIFDPVSGLTFTLEEAERGIFRPNEFHNAVDSGEELHKYFTEEELETEIIKNFINSEEQLLTDVSKNIFLEKIISKADFVKKYDNFSVGHTVSIADNLFVSLISVEYSFPDGQYRNEGNEWQILVSVSVEEVDSLHSKNRSLAHELVHLLHKMTKEISVEQKGGYCMIKINKAATLSSYNQIISKIKFTQANPA